MQIGTSAIVKDFVRTTAIRARDMALAPLWQLGAEPVNFLWFESRNWGDALNPVLIRWLSGKPVRGIDLKAQFPRARLRPHSSPWYLVVGSTLGFADENTIVWGSGFISEVSRTQQRPLRVCAVRGPLSRSLLLKQGIDCPPIYGDPALLFPRLYTPSSSAKRYRLGIIPHYVDMDVPVLRELRHRDDIALIDIKSGLKAVADLLYSCERIASSSLHGLILADAYGIPSCWIELSRRIAGGWFKFIDYFCSVGRAVDRPVPLSSSSDLRTIQRSCMCSPMKIDLDRLLACCPFRGR